MDPEPRRNDRGATSRNRRVKFNVGGQMFEISHDIVMRHPNTMLAKSVSETRLRDDPTSAIFIDGDGERFRYILDYLRSGSIILPMGLPKAAILKDLDYYGFENVNPDDIDASSATNEAMAQVLMKQSEGQTHAKEMQEKIALLEREKIYRMVAHEYYKIYGYGGRTKKIAMGQSANLSLPFNDLLHAFFPFDEELFNKCLAEYGFYHLSFELCYAHPPNNYYNFSFGILGAKRP